MIGWMLAKHRRWRGRSKREQVETSTLWSLTSMLWIAYLSGGLQLLAGVVHEPLPIALGCAIVALGLGQCVVGVGLLRQALDHYLGTGALPRLRLTLMAASMTALTAFTLVLAGTGGVRGDIPETMVLFGVVTPFFSAFALVVPVRTMAWTYGGYIVAVTAGLGLTGVMVGSQLVGTTVALAVFGTAVIFSARCSAWYLAVMRELDEARDVQSQLAVAEERLRFGRDLHDVMGRNLSVIALKSELAAQLVRRGAPEAESQMVEVQRIAQASQREVREVVRGYRAADLRTELTGARSILQAAGIDCRIDEDGQAELPEPVQSALGWVVREGTTNVLRHTGAGRCGVTLRVSTPEGRSAVLAMENDGVAQGSAPSQDSSPGGSGLAGLRERLAALGGTLLTESSAGGSFRLTARIPLADEEEQLRGAELR